MRPVRWCNEHNQPLIDTSCECLPICPEGHDLEQWQVVDLDQPRGSDLFLLYDPFDQGWADRQEAAAARQPAHLDWLDQPEHWAKRVGHVRKEQHFFTRLLHGRV